MADPKGNAMDAQLNSTVRVDAKTSERFTMTPHFAPQSAALYDAVLCNAHHSICVVPVDCL